MSNPVRAQLMLIVASCSGVQDDAADFRVSVPLGGPVYFQIALQLTDTHPSLAIAELLRILIDEEQLKWNRAWDIFCEVFSFTTHTVLPESLEKIPVDLLGSLLPRHLQILYDVNFKFMEDLKKKIGLDYDRLARMSIVEEGAVKQIRMANLSVVCSRTVNGVSRAHLELLRTRVFKDFYELWPEKFQYITNEATQAGTSTIARFGLVVDLSI